MVLQEWEFSLSLKDSSARGICGSPNAWRTGRGLSSAVDLQLSRSLVRHFLLDLLREPCRVLRFLPVGGGFAHVVKAVYLFFLTEVISSSPGNVLLQEGAAPL